MKIYTDKGLMEEVQILDLGILDAGEVKQYTFWVYNDTTALLRELKFSVEHEEVEIISAPETLSAQSVDEIIIEWSPSITLKEGLKTRLDVNGKQRWG